MSKFNVSNITQKARARPNRVILHAVGGWGKTSFAAQIPGSIFLMIGKETGLWTLMQAGQVPESVSHFPDPAETVRDVHDALDSLIREKHPHKALVVDALSGIETLLAEQIIKTVYHNDASEANEWGGDKLSKLAANEWEKITARLDALTERGVGVFLISHSRVVNFKNPEGPDYERWESLTKHSWSKLYQWADMVLFGGFETTTMKRDKRKNDAETKAKASGGETRVLHCERRAAFDAKNRHGLPSQIDCGASAAEAWANFINHLKPKKASSTNGHVQRQGEVPSADHLRENVNHVKQEPAN